MSEGKKRAMLAALTSEVLREWNASDLDPHCKVLWGRPVAEGGLAVVVAVADWFAVTLHISHRDVGTLSGRWGRWGRWVYAVPGMTAVAEVNLDFLRWVVAMEKATTDKERGAVFRRAIWDRAPDAGAARSCLHEWGFRDDQDGMTRDAGRVGVLATAVAPSDVDLTLDELAVVISDKEAPSAREKPTAHSAN